MIGKLPPSIHAWGVKNPGDKLIPFEKPMKDLSPYEVCLRVVASGICHSDIHLIDDDWQISQYPLIPGHEILGEVVALGDAVKNLKLGDSAGVGWQRSACLECELCSSQRDNMCSEKKATCVGFWGGYANYHVTDARYAFLTQTLNPALAPLMCGGATVFSPLVQFLDNKKQRTASVGVVGLGGLGHLAVKFAVAMGYSVTLFSSSLAKKAEAETMGVRQFVDSSSADSIVNFGQNLDLIIMTANVDLPWPAYLSTLKVDGTLCFVGIPPSPMTFHVSEILDRRIKITASPICDRYNLQRMVEFAETHQLGATIETYPMDRVNDAIQAVRDQKVRYRAVLI